MDNGIINRQISLQEQNIDKITSEQIKPAAKMKHVFCMLRLEYRTMHEACVCKKQRSNDQKIV
jgi:hypothetical protein